MRALFHFFFALTLFVTLSSQAANAQMRANSAPLPAIYFDLGDVLIDTKDPRGFHYMPGAVAHVTSLLHRGHSLRLITNIPETWGKTYEEKLLNLKNYVASKWIEREPFPWHIFDVILLPPNDQLRKPHPYLFIEGLKLAGPCQPVYQAEDAEEVKVARDLGYLSFLVGAAFNGGRPLFPSPNEFGCRPFSAEAAFRRYLFAKRGF